MPRKSTKTAPEGKNSAQILEDQASKGKPEGSPAKEQEKKKTGRPSKYTHETAQKMCELLSEGIPLREICRMEGMPAWRTVYDWMYRDDALGADGVGLSASIARARDIGYDAMAEECLEIANTMQFGKVYSESTDKNGAVSKVVTTEDLLGHRKLQIETRLKLLAKFHPKKYGDRQTIAGDSENPLEVQNSAMDILAAAIKNLELKRQTAND
jgi:hypothetical protein